MRYAVTVISVAPRDRSTSRGGDQRWDRAAIITTRLFTVGSATSQPVQRVGPSINVAALPNPPDEASDIAASLQRLGLGERHPAS